MQAHFQNGINPGRINFKEYMMHGRKEGVLSLVKSEIVIFMIHYKLP